MADRTEEARVLLKEAQKLAAQGKYSEALKLTDQVLSVKPDLAEVYVLRGSIYGIMEDMETAIAEIREGEAIFEARNDLEKAAVMRQFADDLQESLDDGSWAEELEEERRIEEENAL